MAHDIVVCGANDATVAGKLAAGFTPIRQSESNLWVSPRLFNTDTLEYEAETVSAGGGVGAEVIVTNTVTVSGTVAISGSVPVTGPLTDVQLRATPVPVSVTGGATSANQITELASLASIDAKTPVLGQQLAAGSSPVVLTAAQLATLTPLAIVGIVGNVEVVNDVGNPLPVSGTVAITAAALPLPANASQETGGNLASVKTNTDPLVAPAAGGYVRQDSTATIAKESGGNLATVVASIGSVAIGDTPGSGSELDRLRQLNIKVDTLNATAKAQAATMLQVVAALKPRGGASYSTLLHR